MAIQEEEEKESIEKRRVLGIFTYIVSERWSSLSGGNLTGRDPLGPSPPLKSYI
jgi:hypothetical protein